MGFQEFFGSISHIYNKVKSGVSEIYNTGKNILHGARGAFDWIDSQLDRVSSIPFIGELLEEGLDELRDTQVFGVSWNRLKRGIDHLDDFIDHSEFVSIANNLDTAITSALEAGQAYGGELDIALGYQAGPQIQGGLSF